MANGDTPAAAVPVPEVAAITPDMSAAEKADAKDMQAGADSAAKAVTLNQNPVLIAAGAARVLANSAVDAAVLASSGGTQKPHGDLKGKHAGKKFTAIHPIIRHGKAVHIGSSVTFDDGEDTHVDTLLADGTIADADHAEVAMSQADLARGQAIINSGG